MSGVAFQEVHTGDETFDLGAYADAIVRVSCARAAFLNTGSEPIASNWLAQAQRRSGLAWDGPCGRIRLIPSRRRLGVRSRIFTCAPMPS